MTTHNTRRLVLGFSLLMTTFVVNTYAQVQDRAGATTTNVDATQPVASEDVHAVGPLTETKNKKAPVPNELSSTLAELDSTGESRTGSKTNPQTSSTDKWQFQLTPYLWIAGINGDAGIGDLVVKVDSGITQSHVHLNFGFMSTFEARKDKFVLLTDLQYSNLGTERPTPGPIFSNATADFKTFILDPEVGYRVARNTEKGRFLDVLGGIRYWHLRADLAANGQIRAISVTASRGWVDAVAGLRGRAHLTPKLFVVGKADLGGGGSKFTYQLFGGVGYQISKRLALLGGYRDISVDYDKNNFLFDMTLAGPIFGLGIKF